MKRLKADPEFEALRLAVSWRQRPTRSRRSAGLRLSRRRWPVAVYGSARSEIAKRLSLMTDTVPYERTEEELVAELRAGSGGGANEARERGVRQGSRRSLRRGSVHSCDQETGETLRQTCLLVYRMLLLRGRPSHAATTLSPNIARKSPSKKPVVAGRGRKILSELLANPSDDPRKNAGHFLRAGDPRKNASHFLRGADPRK